MSHVKKIRFDSVNKNEGCTCDRCGQYIKNIWSVEYTEGFTVHYGIDCWEKVYKAGKLNQYGEKEMRKIMKKIKGWEELLKKWENNEVKPEDDYAYTTAQEDKRSPWYGVDFEEYRKWMIEEFIKYRLDCAEEELKKFRKIDFND